jgi:cobalt-zinc-cadmium efflux system protein
VTHVHDPAPTGAAGQARALWIALGLNAAYTAGEAVAGFLTNSLALVADAAHNLSDVAALGIALVATLLAARPATPQRSFGYKRAEILSALANGVLLVALSIWIFVEAGRRLAEPEDVGGGWLIVVAGIGIAVNLVSGLVLWRQHAGSLNLRAATVHLAGDALSSLGVVVAGAVIITTGWLEADPVVSMLIGVLVLVSSFGILRDAVSILLEEAPRGIDAAEVGSRMAAFPGVVDVHDLHIWTITSGFPALAAHVLVRPGEDCHAKRRELEALLRSDYGIEHTTLQVDHGPSRDALIGVEELRPGLRRSRPNASPDASWKRPP